jgi:excisionase family DNA binding protein
MQLTLTQAAQLLGKTRRQVEYLILQGRLPARKVGERWQIEDTDLPLSPGQRQAGRRRADGLRDAAAAVLEAGAPRPRYSMRDLHAFAAARTLWHDSAGILPADHPARTYLRAALDHLARGCHRFEQPDKGAAYHDARDALSLAACALLLDTDESLIALAERIEGDAIPAVAGLLRRTDRKRRAAER